MFIRPRLLSLITTRQCTAACDHCCFGCSPVQSAAIPVERLRSLIDEAAAFGTFETVGFTGGECFLLGKALDALVARARDHGLRTRVVTNGYWATAPQVARNRIGALREAGLNEVHLSTGTFHARYVPVERVLHAARAAAGAGLITTVWIEEREGSAFDTAAVHAALDDLAREQRLYIGRQPWIESVHGGEARLAHDPSLSRFAAAEGRGCGSVLDIVSVTPEQQVLACCGFTMDAIPDLRLGSVAERALGDVLTDAPNDFLKYWIHVEGPEAVLEFVRRFVPDYRLPVESPAMCQTCLHLHRDEVAQRTIFEHLDALPVAAVVAAFTAELERRGSSVAAA